MNLDSRHILMDVSYLAAAMSSFGLGGLCFAEPFVTAGACVIGMVVCVVDPELGLLCECDDVPFEDGCGTDREGVERGVVELLVTYNSIEMLFNV